MDLLTLRIQDRIRTGRLPGGDCAATWYREGRGQRCAACDERILGTDLGVDCDLVGGATVQFHARCYIVWHSLLAT
jgi:hypothetical protein